MSDVRIVQSKSDSDHQLLAAGYTLTPIHDKTNEENNRDWIIINSQRTAGRETRDIFHTSFGLVGYTLESVRRNCKIFL